MRLISIVGARPQFVKLSPIIRALQSYKDIHHIIIHTGQHYDYMMNKVFFDELGIPESQYNLEVGSASHGAQTGLMLTRIEEALVKENPDWVLVYGDTNSTLAGTLAAVKLHIPVAHIEAGLRSYNKYMPEEINRVLTDHMSTVLFCPTVQGVTNLKQEGFVNIVDQGLIDSASLKSMDIVADQDNPLVINVGDIMYDSLLLCMELAAANSGIMDVIGLKPGEYFLATIHRVENTDDDSRLRSILGALNELSRDKEVILPLHPRTKNKLKSVGSFNIESGVRICEPVGYFDMLMLEKNAYQILTDSGGVQKEAYILGVPCITLRDQTEWIETVNDGMNVITGANKDKIIEASRKTFNKNVRIVAYGDGKASKRILQTFLALSGN